LAASRAKAATSRGAYQERAEDAGRLAIVQVRSHSRQRQNVVTVMTFASVSTPLPLQKGQVVGLATAGLNSDSDMLLFLFSKVRLFDAMPAVSMTHDACMLTAAYVQN
jgi:hypothetical protein